MTLTHGGSRISSNLNYVRGGFTPPPFQLQGLGDTSFSDFLNNLPADQQALYYAYQAANPASPISGDMTNAGAGGMSIGSLLANPFIWIGGAAILLIAAKNR